MCRRMREIRSHLETEESNQKFVEVVKSDDEKINSVRDEWITEHDLAKREEKKRYEGMLG